VTDESSCASSVGCARFLTGIEADSGICQGVVCVSKNGAHRLKSVAILGTRGYPSFYGGFETAVRRLAPYLADQGWLVSVYGRRGAVEAESADGRIQQVTTPGIDNKLLSTLSYGFTSAVHAAIKKPDVVLVMNVANGFWLPILRMRGIKTIVNVDGMEWERAKWGRLAKKVFLYGARLTAKWADEIVVDAQAIGDRWTKEFNREGLFIPYGGDVPEDSPVEPGLERREYVLMVARFVPENSVQEFFDAVPTLAESFPVVIVGSSGYEGYFDQRARELAHEYPGVHWLGHLRNDARLFSLWQNAGAYFHGHSVGGTNPALVQAMACGAPVVARNTVYNREVIMHAGVFVEAKSHEVAAALTALMKDPSRQAHFSSAARLRAEHAYSWSKVCSDYETALNNLLAKVRGK
jgi:glycosyltransferase involved in cell wall biosynthesis